MKNLFLQGEDTHNGTKKCYLSYKSNLILSITTSEEIQDMHYVYLLAGSVLLGTLFGCTMPQQDQVVQSDGVTVTSNAPQTSYNSKSPRPATKTATITIEGEKTPITLKLYEEQNELFITYFPSEEFVAESVSSGEGTAVKFITNFDGNKDENAYISIFFPNNVNTIKQLESFVNGQSGLLAANKWQVSSRTQNVSYAWAKEKIDFRQGQEIIGTLYLGEQNGKVFYVIIHYPAEYGDGLTPRADLILQNLQVGG